MVNTMVFGFLEIPIIFVMQYDDFLHWIWLRIYFQYMTDMTRHKRLQQSPAASWAWLAARRHLRHLSWSKWVGRVVSHMHTGNVPNGARQRDEQTVWCCTTENQSTQVPVYLVPIKRRSTSAPSDLTCRSNLTDQFTSLLTDREPRVAQVVL